MPLPDHDVRLRNTVRLQVKADADPEVKRRFGRDFVVTDLLREVFGISASLIFCLQDLNIFWIYGSNFFSIEGLFSFF